MRPKNTNVIRNYPTPCARFWSEGKKDMLLDTAGLPISRVLSKRYI
jgi:hypothetical protein